MLNLQQIKQHPQQFDQAMQNRGLSIRSQQLLDLDQQKRQQIQAIQELQAQKNDLVNQIAIAKKQNLSSDDLTNQVKQLNQQIANLQSQPDLALQLNELLSTIPNIPCSSVPYGSSEEHNVVIQTFGTIPNFSFPVLSHDELGKKLGMLDFEKSVAMSGTRFSTLTKHLALLERALANFMLDTAIAHNYCEVSPPNIVKSQAMQFAGQLPKFAEEAFSTKDDYWLIPTAEVSLVNLVAQSTIDSQQLPLRFTAYTPCFRREAGAAGKDTKGMIRQHQFKKVELVAITTQEQSIAEHEHLTNIACEILQKLELPFRKILLCTGDMGFCSQKTYDLEVWLPSQNKYREISSCSNCGDFQARRAGIKYKQNGATFFAHTLNGSALAVGRTLLAILENYQCADGSITVPTVLQAYMGQLTKISI